MNTVSIIVSITCLLIGLSIGLVIKLIQVKQKNQEIEKEEQQAQLRIKDLEKEYIFKHAELEKEYTEASEKCVKDLERQDAHLTEEANRKVAEIIQMRTDWEKEKNQKQISWLQREQDLKSEVASLDSQIKEKKKIIQQVSEDAKIIEEQAINNAIGNIEQQSKDLINNYEKLETDLISHYINLVNEQQNVYSKQDEELSNKILEKENKLEELRRKVNATVEANKRAELEHQEKDFYRLQLSELDIEEIKRIRSIEPYLRKKEPLNKVIWKSYYEKPYTDLIGRVIGTGRKTGIYKITNIENGMCYIGQATDLSERWKQHIKRGIGADPPTQNKLYPAMLSIGVENFTFEVLEECKNSELTEREKFYTDFYKAQEFGYSIRKG